MDVNKRFNEHDEMMAEMYRTIDRINAELAKREKRMEAAEKRMERAEIINEKRDRRMDLTIKRMVKAEARLDAAEKRMKAFDEKLIQSLKDQKATSAMQAKVNQYFLDYIRKNKL